MTDTRNDAEGRPRTAAGRRLVGMDMGPVADYWVNLGSNEMIRAILDIEREAAAHQSPSGNGPRLREVIAGAILDWKDQDLADLLYERVLPLLAAAQPPSGDAPDLREALVAIPFPPIPTPPLVSEHVHEAIRLNVEAYRDALIAAASAPPKGNR